MKVEIVIDFLHLKRFEQYQFESELMTQFEEHNINIWASDTRLIMLKEYRTQNSLIDWEIKDQACIASVFYHIPKKYLNNLYFFMILNFNNDEIELRLKINKIEKNELVCKKYILKDIDELNRIPFLMEKAPESDTFAFDQKFKKRIMKFNEQNDGEGDLSLEKVMDDYFNNYLSNKQASKLKIDSLLQIGD
ncbi:ABC-three component system middle component 1 [Priestia sp. GS2]|uniref:ABC-three component system middle component 1 n=1 Tax=Priestia sp. GS2 TaxID=3117403 RepID=UPI002ED7F725